AQPRNTRYRRARRAGDRRAPPRTRHRGRQGAAAVPTVAPLGRYRARCGHRWPKSPVREFDRAGAARPRCRACRSRSLAAAQAPADARCDGPRRGLAPPRPRRAALVSRLPLLLGARLAAQPVRRQAVEIIAPALLLLHAELVEIAPGINPGIVEIVEDDANGVIADRFEADDPDMSAAVDQCLLPSTVPLHLGRRTLDSQILGRKLKPAAVVERHL